MRCGPSGFGAFWAASNLSRESLGGQLNKWCKMQISSRFVRLCSNVRIIILVIQINYRAYSSYAHLRDILEFSEIPHHCRDKVNVN